MMNYFEGETVESQAMASSRLFILAMSGMRCDKKDLMLNFNVKVDRAAAFFADLRRFGSVK